MSVSERSPAIAAALALAASLVLLAAPPSPARVRRSSMRSVIVRETIDAGSAPERAVVSLGGRVGDHIDLIDAFTAEIPRPALSQLRLVPGVRSVTSDATLRPQAARIDGIDMARAAGSMVSAVQDINALGLWKDGITGRGVGVALIDSGVAPVEGLDDEARVLHGPDLSFESQADNLRHLDTFGHGTHMAGIIAGRDGDARVHDSNGDGDYRDEGDEGYDDLYRRHFVGLAPDATLLSIKVADSSGATDVSQVIAAIDWVVKHRRALDIRVLNLSYGTNGTQDYTLDPLTYAVEVAWRKGIVVVVAAGNEGFGSPQLNNPAYDPFVVAVGADDTKGTGAYHDDAVPDFSARGSVTRHPDVVAPGKSVVSLRAAGSHLDAEYPGARVGNTPRFLRGSGTSQAAAMVSGAAALLIDQRPRLTPDAVKRLLMNTSHSLPSADDMAQGRGLIDLARASAAGIPTATQSWAPATGLGSLDASRGTTDVLDLGDALVGEQDIFGTAWNASDWTLRAASDPETAWSGGDWLDHPWTGSGWTLNRWNAITWTNSSWSGRSWTGRSWTTSQFLGRRWTSSEWADEDGLSTNTLTGRTWSSYGWNVEDRSKK